jgi:triosephosphate isomerase
MRKILIAGNWKMHLNTHQASLLVHRLHERIQIHRSIEVVLCPPMLTLQPISLQIDRRKFRLGAQNAYHKDEGAYTGEVSFTMLQGLVHYALVGHSERRHVFNESLDDVAAKVAASVRNGITPILCVGETHLEKVAHETHQVLHDQVMSALSGLTAENVENMVIAYEPVWAIGAGVTPKPHEVEDAIKTIRHNISELYGKKAAEKVRVIYGASVKPDNARGLLDIPGNDGLLVGGASINYMQFAGIVDAGYRAQRERGE